MMRPKQVLSEISKKWPNAWQIIKGFRSDKGKKLPDWPDWCYMPIAAGIAIATQSDSNKLSQAMLDERLSPAVIAAAAAWRISQGVYRFDADLYNALINQPMDGDLPCETLKRLPEWCVYIETKSATFYGSPVAGFWAHLEHDINDGRMELRLVLIYEDGRNFPLPVHLGNWTIDEGLRRAQKESSKQVGIHLQGYELPLIDLSLNITPLVQLVLYLCADNIDMPMRPAHPNTRVRLSGQADIVRDVRFWTVGERIGAAIRKHRNLSQQTPDSTHGSHASPRPHVRRAHWHHFWTGPKAGEQKLILRWLPPIPVGCGDEQDMPVVIYSVRE
jgi:hypothetical protein